MGTKLTGLIAGALLLGGTAAFADGPGEPVYTSYAPPVQEQVIVTETIQPTRTFSSPAIAVCDCCGNVMYVGGHHIVRSDGSTTSLVILN